MFLGAKLLMEVMEKNLTIIEVINGTDSLMIKTLTTHLDLI